jgi:hypothetical protein
MADVDIAPNFGAELKVSRRLVKSRGLLINVL